MRDAPGSGWGQGVRGGWTYHGEGGPGEGGERDLALLPPFSFHYFYYSFYSLPTEKELEFLSTLQSDSPDFNIFLYSLYPFTFSELVDSKLQA